MEPQVPQPDSLGCLEAVDWLPEALRPSIEAKLLMLSSKVRGQISERRWDFCSAAFNTIATELFSSGLLSAERLLSASLREMVIVIEHGFWPQSEPVALHHLEIYIRQRVRYWQGRLLLAGTARENAEPPTPANPQQAALLDLHDLGLVTPALDEMTALEITAELRCIDGRYGESPPLKSGGWRQPLFAAYHEIAKRVVRPDTTDDFLEEEMALVIDAIRLKKAWDPRGVHPDTIKRALWPVVEQWKGKRDVMYVECRPPIAGRPSEPSVPDNLAERNVASPPRRKPGRPTEIPDERKRQALAARGGKTRAQILYATKYPTPQQVKNVSSILKYYREKCQPCDG